MNWPVGGTPHGLRRLVPYVAVRPSTGRAGGGTIP